MNFVDAHERTIDDKNRVQIPASFRGAPDADPEACAFYVVPGERDNTLSLYPAAYFESRLAAIQTDQMPGTDSIDFEQMFFSMASRVVPDKQGRVVLPPRQLASVNLGKEVYVTGANYRLDLWRKSDYVQFLEQVKPRRATLQRFLRMPNPPAGANGGSNSNAK